jgi:thiamine pyrophosphokinase
MKMDDLSFEQPITLVGAGPCGADLLQACLSIAPLSLAADGGAATLLRNGHRPLAVIGDMDSLRDEVLSPEHQAQLSSDDILHPIAEQETTDFEKCVTSIRTPLILGAGFLGGRVDHQLAAQNVLVRYPHHKCILIGDEDIMFVLPPDLALNLEVGMRISLFPMAEARVKSKGLFWATEGLAFTPNGQIGTSNRVTGPVRLLAQTPTMLLILPRSTLVVAVAALQQAGAWHTSWQ